MIVLRSQISCNLVFTWNRAYDFMCETNPCTVMLGQNISGGTLLPWYNLGQDVYPTCHRWIAIKSQSLFTGPDNTIVDMHISQHHPFIYQVVFLVMKQYRSGLLPERHHD